MALELIIGISIVAFLFLYFALNLGEEHFILKLLLIIFFAATLIMIAPATMKDDCELKVANETVAASVTSYEYKTVCDEEDSTIKNNFLEISLWFFRLFIIYISVYLIYNWARKSERFLKWFGKQK